MAANVESLGALERRVSMSVPVEEIDRQVDERLKKLARDVRITNDANCFALSEASDGAGRGAAVVFVSTVTFSIRTASLR